MTTTGAPSPTPEEINEIVRTFGESELEYLLLELPGARIELSKADGAALGSGPARTYAAPAAAAASAPSVPAPPVSVPPAPANPAPVDALPPTGAAPASAAKPAPAATAGSDAVVAPALGVFYRRPAPDSPPYVEVGSVVGPDTPVATLEVMKMFTEVRAGVAGVITAILVENEDMVEKGQVIMHVAPQ